MLRHAPFSFFKKNPSGTFIYVISVFPIYHIALMREQNVKLKDLLGPHSTTNQLGRLVVPLPVRKNVYIWDDSTAT